MANELSEIAIYSAIDQLAEDFKGRGVSIEAIAQLLMASGAALECEKNGTDRAASLLELAARALRDLDEGNRAKLGDH